jgi:hypothetical protein
MRGWLFSLLAIWPACSTEAGNSSDAAADFAQSPAAEDLGVGWPPCVTGFWQACPLPSGAAPCMFEYTDGGGAFEYCYNNGVTVRNDFAGKWNVFVNNSLCYSMTFTHFPAGECSSQMWTKSFYDPSGNLIVSLGSCGGLCPSGVCGSCNGQYFLPPQTPVPFTTPDEAGYQCQPGVCTP